MVLAAQSPAFTHTCIVRSNIVAIQGAASNAGQHTKACREDTRDNKQIGGIGRRVRIEMKENAARLDPILNVTLASLLPYPLKNAQGEVCVKTYRRVIGLPSCGNLIVELPSNSVCKTEYGRARTKHAA